MFKPALEANTKEHPTCGHSNLHSEIASAFGVTVIGSYFLTCSTFVFGSDTFMSASFLDPIAIAVILSEAF